ncbi:phosphoglucomutase/phosphomannomutase PgmG [Oleispirillum naphthae]|uniref:phosphoglucomutase/phosphomannomutase PgmG n=1 Tax=Oleispirillum naphthae TaxID=2838853 RepID=UPI00308238B6
MTVHGHRFHPAILRDYDIRGEVGRTLRIADAVALGMAFGSRLIEAGGGTVAVARDGRLSSPDLAAALIDGLTASGVTVLSVGRGPTPMLFFAVEALKADAGIIVTASHNPADHNGFKMVMGGRPLFGPDIRALGARAAAGDFVSGDGAVEEREVEDAYVARLLRDIAPARPLSVVWDCGNGATGPVAEALARRLPGRHRVLFPEVDGRFPHHHPDPAVAANLAPLAAAVRAEGADLGVAFDGDGDRLGVVDETGEILWGDRILALLAEDVLARRPGATVIADVKSSQTLFDRIRALGGAPLMSRTGHSLIRARMAEEGAPLAGEMSGHIFFADRYYGFDDGLYAALRLIEGLAARQGGLSAWHGALPRLPATPEVRIPCGEEEKFAVVDAVAARLAEAGAEVETVDGVRVKTAEGWWLLRASNTQAELTVRAEAKTEAGLAAAVAAVAAHLAAAGVAPPEALRA